MSQNVGRINFYVNGALIETLEGAELKLGGLSASPENTDQLQTHYVETYTNSMVTCTIPINNNTPLEELRNLRDATGTFECDNGITYNLTALCSHNAGEFGVKKGGLAGEFFGNAAKPGS